MILFMIALLGFQGLFFLVTIQLYRKTLRSCMSELKLQRELRLKWFGMALDTAIKLDVEQRRRGRGTQPEAWA